MSAVTAENNSGNDFAPTWSWNAVAGASGYLVLRYSNNPNAAGFGVPFAFDYFMDVGNVTSFQDYGDEWQPLTITVFNSTLKSYQPSIIANGAITFASNRQADQTEFSVPLMTVGSEGDSQQVFKYSGQYWRLEDSNGNRSTLSANIVASNIQTTSMSATTYSGGTYNGNFNIGGSLKVVVTNTSGVMVTSGVDLKHYTGSVGTALIVGSGKGTWTTGDDTHRLWLMLSTGSTVTALFTNSVTGNTYLSGTIMGVNVNGGFFISNRMSVGSGFSTIELQNQVNLTAGTTTYVPLMFRSGTLMTSPTIGGVEMVTDKLYFTITTGGARKEIALNDAALSSGLAVITTTNGRLATSATTDTQIGYLSSTTSDVQTQINAKNKRVIHMLVQNAKLPASNPARIDAGDQNWRLLFDPATSQSAIWQFVMPQDFASVIAFSVRLLFTMASTQSGTNAVIWRTYIMAITAGDNEDINSNGFDSANSGTATLTNNLTAGYVQSISITQTNKDSLSGGDIVQFKIDRDAAAGGDTATGDAELVGILLEYTSS